MDSRTLLSKNLIKVMWVPHESNFLWKMKDESPIDIGNPIYQQVYNDLNLEDWGKHYGVLYKTWIENDVTDLFELTNEVNTSLLLKIRKWNLKPNPEVIIFHWFDLDRSTTSENKSWTQSPLSGDELINLGEDFHYLNRLVSLKDFLVFPDINPKGIYESN